MQILSLAEIKNRLGQDKTSLIKNQEDGFVAYSEGRVVVPQVGHIGFPVGDCHIKYGMISGDDHFVIKIASGFPNNPQAHGISVIQGLILVLSAQTGQPLFLLQDEGYLTNLRTALAGLIAAKYLAPKNISAIGVLGVGGQARLQVRMLKELTPCRTIWVWGRSREKVGQYINEMSTEGFMVQAAQSPKEVANYCNLIITTTSSTHPLLKIGDIQAGTHITAVGADCPGKNEIDPEVFAKADICAVDSKSQCCHHGDASHAIRAGLISESQLLELGQIIAMPHLGRTSEKQITIADLTGVAVQDIQIAKTVLGLSLR